jgi:hypothetical protein
MRLERIAAVAGCALILAASAAAQVPTEGKHNADLAGVWTNVNLPGTSEWAIYTFSKDLPEMTAWGKARFDAAKPQRGPRGVPVAETDDLVYKCYPPGTPRIYIHPFPMEIIQLPGRVLQVFEYDHLVRAIYTDGREHRDDLAPSWMGDSIGHWEGDTLVVDTTNFPPQQSFRGSSENLHVVERFRRVDANTINYRFTVDDPTTFTAPFSGEIPFRAMNELIYEYACHEGNYALSNVLSGARNEEKRLGTKQEK